jgi:hypothetical protein
MTNGPGLQPLRLLPVLLKPIFFYALFGATEQLAEKIVRT